MSALGEFLVRERWISDEELSDALLEQQSVGGRLGTMLLEKGYLGEDLLLRALSDQQEVPSANASARSGGRSSSDRTENGRLPR